MIDRIKSVLALGATEDRVVELFDLTHIKLRTLAKRYNLDIDYKIITESLLDEIDNSWSTAQINNRYYIPISTAQQIHDGTYRLPARTPDIDYITLQTMLQQGQPVNDIADELEVSPYYVKKMMLKHNLTSEARRKKITLDQYNSIAELLIAGDMQSTSIAKLYNISTSMVSHIKSETLVDKPYRKPYATVDKELVEALIAKGQTQESVAAQLGVSQSSVSRVVAACRNS